MGIKLKEKKYAVVKEGRVENVIVANDEYKEKTKKKLIEIKKGQPCQKGDFWDGREFIREEKIEVKTKEEEMKERINELEERLSVLEEKGD